MCKIAVHLLYSQKVRHGHTTNASVPYALSKEKAAGYFPLQLLHKQRALADVAIVNKQ